LPLLGKAEKGQLELMILARLEAYYDSHGASSLLGENMRVVVNAEGAALDTGEQADPLAAVPIRSLFTALCYLTAGSPTMPRESLQSLATEATSAAAAQINRLAPD
jgi:hypothetical protein